jgi:hypothetical protein
MLKTIILLESLESLLKSYTLSQGLHHMDFAAKSSAILIPPHFSRKRFEAGNFMINILS